MRRFLLPVGVSVLFVAWSPFVGEIRTLIRDTFPNQFVAIMTLTVGFGLCVAAGSAVAGIRVHRLSRYGMVILSGGLATWYAVTLATGNPDVDAVERFHFLEYGLVGLLFYRALSGTASVASLPTLVALALLCGALVGTAEEWMQWLAPRRVGEARDVVLNLYAVMCGIVFGLGVRPPVRSTGPSIPSTAGAQGTMSEGSARVEWWHVEWRPVAALGAVALAAFAIFYDVAHLGYAVTDEEIGQFRSAFTHDALIDLQRERAAAWSADPPRELPLIGKEDFYLTEGGWRVQYRNDLYARQRFSEAWLENRILEKYWDPFLELQSFSSGDRHRWPSAQRAEVEAQRGHVRPGTYLSPVGEAVIVTWPTRAQFWMAIGVIELGLLSVWLGSRHRKTGTQ